MVIKCTECKTPRLMYAQKKLKNNECNAVKRALSGLEYVCGSSFKEFLGDTNNRDTTTFALVFARENLSCTSNVELPYYSCDNLKPVCIYCGCNKNVTKTIEFYPKCSRCKGEKDIAKRKRKTVVANDLVSKKKKCIFLRHESPVLCIYLCCWYHSTILHNKHIT